MSSEPPKSVATDAIEPQSFTALASSLPSDKGLSEALLANLDQLGYRQMTPIQQLALPPLLAGQDVLGQAQTGSGKTAAFGLGLLAQLQVTQFQTQSLVLCPTRELAEQVAGELRRLARGIHNVKVLTLCGGVPIGPQIGSLERSAHIVVGTPGRLLKHLNKRTLKLGGLRTLVLDEADRMLDMGFADEINQIMAFVPAKRQTLLFSATFPAAIESLSRAWQVDPQLIDATAEEPAPAIDQFWCSADHGGRAATLYALLCYWATDRTLVFCNTKDDVKETAAYLKQQGIAVATLHGDLEQQERRSALLCFAHGSVRVLLATDVAARGLDISDVTLVINFELPNQPEVYVHRIGRTGRAGEAGIALSLVTQRQESRLDVLANVEKLHPVQFSPLPIRSEMPGRLNPVVRTLEINGGRNHKLRPGDLLGALTAQGGVKGDVVGKIDVLENSACVSIESSQFSRALQQLNSQPIKGRKLKARELRPVVA